MLTMMRFIMATSWVGAAVACRATDPPSFRVSAENTTLIVAH